MDTAGDSVVKGLSAGGHDHGVRYAELTTTDILPKDDIALYRATRQVRRRTEYPSQTIRST